jgi:hypothetical protein
VPGKEGGRMAELTFGPDTRQLLVGRLLFMLKALSEAEKIEAKGYESTERAFSSMRLTEGISIHLLSISLLTYLPFSIVT